MLGGYNACSGLLRPHKPGKDEPVPLARKAFEVTHKNVGRAAPVLAFIAVLSGEGCCSQRRQRGFPNASRAPGGDPSPSLTRPPHALALLSGCMGWGGGRAAGVEHAAGYGYIDEGDKGGYMAAAIIPMALYLAALWYYFATAARQD